MALWAGASGILRRKATIISLDVAPYFYALSENYGSPGEDHLLAYQEVRMTSAARQVYEALFDGPLNTIDLRKAARLTSKASDAEFNRALDVLQADFKSLPVGVAQAGSWNYAFTYAITAYHYPDLPEKARSIGETQTREKLLTLYFQSIGAAQLRDVERLFGWGREVTQQAIQRLVKSGFLISGVSLQNQTGSWLAFSSILA